MKIYKNHKRKEKENETHMILVVISMTTFEGKH